MEAGPDGVRYLESSAGHGDGTGDFGDRTERRHFAFLIEALGIQVK
jgi:hypothetical protein